MDLYPKPHGHGRKVWSADALLLALEQAARVHGKRGVRPQVAVDLDGTALDGNMRTIRILEEFLRDGKWLMPLLASGLRSEDLGYGPTTALDALRRLGYTVPDVWYQIFPEYWKQRFFTAEYQDHDGTEVGAPEFVNELVSGLGLQVVYLTGRDRENMMTGVVKNLRDRGFPIMTPATKLVLKPEFVGLDLRFKREALQQLAYLGGPVIGLVDNEPPICNMALAECGVPVVAWFDRPHAPNPPRLLPRVKVMQSFQTNQ